MRPVALALVLLAAAAAAWLVLGRDDGFAPGPAAPDAAEAAAREAGPGPGAAGSAPGALDAEAPREGTRAGLAAAGPAAAGPGRRGDALAVRASQLVDLGRWTVVSGADAVDADFVCEEVSPHAALVAARRGSGPVEPPPSRRWFYEDPPAEPATAGDSRPRAWLAAGEAGAVVLVDHPDGALWRVWVASVDDAARPADRVAWLRRVPTEEPAALPLEDPFAVTPGEGPTAELVTSVLERGAGMPGFPASTGQALQGTWVRAGRVPPRSRLAAFHERVELTGPLDATLSSGAWASLLLRRGTGTSARLVLEHHSTAIASGDVLGEVEVTDHASLVVEGALVGTVTVSPHGILVVAGPMRGTLRLGPYGRALLLGPVEGTLDLSRAREAHLLLGGLWRVGDAARLPSFPGQKSTLWLERSDLGDGAHTGVGGWASVEVGGERWTRLRR